MNKYDKLFNELADRLRNGDRFGLRLNLEGEGKFKDFQGENEIPVLKQFLDKARKDGVEVLIVREEDMEKHVISEF